ncbi:hypothetical protein HY491_03890 [Candidatus Woesearchaeota archaeon]|nr:hypothetical protein [Candidatus Woesearchaeota archaeon]
MTDRERINPREWNSRRRRLRRGAWILGILGILTFLDSGHMFPIPLIGLTSVVTAAILVALAFTCYRMSTAPPTSREILLVAEAHGSYITLAVLLHHFDLPTNQLEKLIIAYWNEGILQAVGRPPGDEPIKQVEVSQIAFKFVGAGERTREHQPAAGPAPEQAVPVRDINDINQALLGGTLDIHGGLPIGGREPQPRS